MFASVVIPTFNRRHLVQQSINSLLNQSIKRQLYEIIVVDDCSRDDTQSYMTELVNQYPNVFYIRHDSNKGRAITRNDGILAARGDIIIFLDDDNVPEQGFVEAHMVNYSQDLDKPIAVMGNASYTSEVTSGSNFAKYIQSRYLGYRSDTDRQGIDYSNLPPRCFGTLNCSARKKDIIAVGLFDTAFQGYGGEDEDLGYRLSQSGVRILFAEQARTWHHDEVSVSRFKKKSIETARDGIKIMRAKHPVYFDGTQVRFLLPVDLGTDTLSMIARKLLMRFILNGVALTVVQAFVVLVDHYPALYFRSLYRFMMAGWVLHGMNVRGAERLVTYDPEKNNSEQV